MKLFSRLDLAGKTQPSIDWDLTPSDTFAMFESWGGKERVRNSRERFYYFFVDNWKSPARVCLMERGIKYARRLAYVQAPQHLVDQCVAGQGQDLSIDRSYAIDGPLRQWLEKNLVENDNDALLIPIVHDDQGQERPTGLPLISTLLPDLDARKFLRSLPDRLSGDEVERLICRQNFFDSRRNPGGSGLYCLTDTGDGLTVIDQMTGLMWQRGGFDIGTVRTLLRRADEANRAEFAGYRDWRLPTLEETLSLLRKEKNPAGLAIHPCFAAEQPFLLTTDGHVPGGQWFVDFRQATAYWASAHNPGGFGRMCRSIEPASRS